MNEEYDNDNGMMLCCACCGIAEVDDIKLKNCTACHLVRYCGVECQRNHRPKHKRACKNRAAELRDELLFKQPDSNHLGDCPICFLPMPFDMSKWSIINCCSKIICDGCIHANEKREMGASLLPSCPFCRERLVVTKEEEVDKRRMKRIEVNDPVAIRQEGFQQYEKGEYSRAFEYWTKAAKLGNAEAHCNLAAMYQYGHGVEKDRGMLVHHLEEAAIGGHPEARYCLGCEEWNNGNTERALRHYMIAARQGFDDSIKDLMDAFKEGLVNRDVLTTALRAHQAAVDATKSPQRETAEEFYRSRTKK